MRYKDFKRYKIKSKERFRELYYFSLQYWDLREQLEAICYVSSPDGDGMPRGSGVGDPTGTKAALIAELSEKVNLIESCVRDADPSIKKGLLKGVTTPNCSPNWLRDHGFLYCGNDKYYLARGKYYWLLDQRKG